MQKILTLLITAAIIYMIFQQNLTLPSSPIINQQGFKPNAANSQEANSAPLEGNFVEKTLSNLVINVLKTDEGRLFLENILQPMQQPMQDQQGFKLDSQQLIDNMFKFATKGIASTGPASCGHIVTIHYEISTLSGLPVESKTLTFPLGSNKGPYGLDAVIAGMFTNQQRTAIVNSKFFPKRSDQQAGAYKVKVKLQNIIPHNFVDHNVQIFDDHLSYNLPLLCGQGATFDAKITDLGNGELIYSSKQSQQPISLIIGDNNYPMILSHALHGKPSVGKRTVIAPGKFFKSYLNNYSKLLPKLALPENKYFMLEIDNVRSNQQVIRTNSEHLSNSTELRN